MVCCKSVVENAGSVNEPLTPSIEYFHWCLWTPPFWQMANPHFHFQDEDVPYETSLLLMERLVTDDVDIVYRKTGNHRLMNHSDLILLLSELERMLKQYPAAKTSGTTSLHPIEAKSKL